MITESEVFDAVRRGYSEFESTSNAEIIDYFSEIDQGSVAGHVSHIKDITVLDSSGFASELQLKATDSMSYVTAAMEENPDIGFVVTSEIAAGMGNDLVVDSGIENAVLDQAVGETLYPVSPLSMIGWAFGLPF